MTRRQKAVWLVGLPILMLVGVSNLVGINLAKNSLSSLGPSDLQSHTPSEIRNAPVQIVNADTIRVGISDDGMQNYEYPLTRFSATGNYRILEKDSQRQIIQGEPNEEVSIRIDKQGFWIDENLKKLGPFQGPLVLEPLGDNSLLKIMNITRKGLHPTYHGTFEVSRGYSSPLKLSVVNILSMQDYLKAVVPNELPFRYGEEAVKAQSIAARNYAVRPREKPWPQFDICDSQLCQVYFGAQTETSETNRALRETEGLFALYDGEPILALYSSSHGGFAENYSNAFSDPLTHKFPATPIPSLIGGPDMEEIHAIYGDLHREKDAKSFWLDQKAPSFDVRSPHYRWEKAWTRPELEMLLKQNLLALSQDNFTSPFVSPLLKPGQSLGELKKINVLQRGDSGKIMVLEIQTTKGCWTLKKEFVIRKAFKNNGKMLPSANIIFTSHYGAKGKLLSIKANGGGFGHGVGMSQLGASWMSHEGYAFPEILKHYYKGIAIGTMPLWVGEGHYLQPVKTSFFAKGDNALLQVKTGESYQGSVNVELNGQKITLDISKEGKASMSLKGMVRAGEENTLVLYPNESKTPVKAWLELYTPNEKDLALTRRIYTGSNTSP